MNNNNKKWVLVLADPAIFFYACAWLMVLTIAGTLAQTDIGLYMSQQKYFSSWFFLMGPVPLPGGRLTLAIIFFNLLFYIFFVASLKKNIGLYITHFGALLLLIGGLLTAYFSTEGTMVINEGETANYVEDYHNREFAVITPGAEDDQVTAFAMGWLKPGMVLKNDSIPGEIRILEAFKNCDAVRRPQADTTFKGFGSRFEIVKKANDPQNERNMFGLVCEISGFGDASDGKYAFIEFQNESTQVGKFSMLLRKERTYLPFEIELLDFQKKVHPGTQMPKSYKSIVNLIENGQKRRVVIQMNEPLRHEGYTFFQSSFMQASGRETTVLAAVKNYGRQFPYISSIIMCIGLLIYLVVMIPGRNKK